MLSRASISFKHWTRSHASHRSCIAQQRTTLSRSNSRVYVLPRHLFTSSRTQLVSSSNSTNRSDLSSSSSNSSTPPPPPSSFPRLRRFFKIIALLSAFGFVCYKAGEGPVFRPWKEYTTEVESKGTDTPLDAQESPSTTSAQKSKELIDPDPFSRNKFLPAWLYLQLRAMLTIVTIAAILTEYTVVYSNSELDYAEREQEEWLAEQRRTGKDIDWSFLQQLQQIAKDNQNVNKQDHTEGASKRTSKRTFRTLIYKSERRKAQERAVHERCAKRMLSLVSVIVNLHITILYCR